MKLAGVILVAVMVSEQYFVEQQDMMIIHCTMHAPWHVLRADVVKFGMLNQQKLLYQKIGMLTRLCTSIVEDAQLYQYCGRRIRIFFALRGGGRSDGTS